MQWLWGTSACTPISVCTCTVALTQAHGEAQTKQNLLSSCKQKVQKAFKSALHAHRLNLMAAHVGPTGWTSGFEIGHQLNRSLSSMGSCLYQTLGDHVRKHICGLQGGSCMEPWNPHTGPRTIPTPWRLCCALLSSRVQLCPSTARAFAHEPALSLSSSLLHSQIVHDGLSVCVFTIQMPSNGCL